MGSVSKYLSFQPTAHFTVCVCGRSVKVYFQCVHFKQLEIQDKNIPEPCCLEKYFNALIPEMSSIKAT